MFTDVVPAVQRLAARASRSCCAAARGCCLSASSASGTGCCRGSRRSTVGARAPEVCAAYVGGRRRRLRRSRGRLYRRHPTRRRRGPGPPRFVGLLRAGHPDALAGSGAKVVGSLSELAADVSEAIRSPLTREAHERDPVLTPRSSPGNQRSRARPSRWAFSFVRTSRRTPATTPMVVIEQLATSTWR